MTEQSPPNPQIPRRLSVPLQPKVRSLVLSMRQREVLRRVAGLLVPGTDADPSATQISDFDSLLDVAILARGESFEELSAASDMLGSHADDVDLDLALRTMNTDDPGRFHLISSVVVGAYLLSPEVRRLINYSGQGRNPASTEQAVEELSDGILDPVIDRGNIYVSATGE